MTVGRSIPACAGKPSYYAAPRPDTAVHPRVCGEAELTGGAVDRQTGPSPRVRGSHPGSSRRVRQVRSIPACAGKPHAASGGPERTRVHPRVCGEAPAAAGRPDVVHGPSPRVRGSRDDVGVLRLVPGSIPACAGKPPAPRASSRHRRVHPRVCGEARPSPPRSRCGWGPSPRVRGSRVLLGPLATPLRSIPACAGKPSCGRPTRAPSAVHPRVCGEALLSTEDYANLQGPSPRVRGSRRLRLRGRPPPGSIPACAGKPASTSSARTTSTVHPRVCGEASQISRCASANPGPSPRVRGSHPAAQLGDLAAGSIPACAGKPTGDAAQASARAVHPRVCGEAMAASALRAWELGPSPRVRGSPRRTRSPGWWAGSIPACAGKPLTTTIPPQYRKVHPRVCGEAALDRGLERRRQGPSPRVRGSPHRARGGLDLPGSIPACAGKPRSRRITRA